MSRAGLLEEGLGPAPAAQEPETERQAHESEIFRKVFTIHPFLHLKKRSIMVISNTAKQEEMGKDIITVKYYNIGLLLRFSSSDLKVPGLKKISATFHDPEHLKVIVGFDGNAAAERIAQFQERK
jgi:hypothetical protein